VSDIAIAVREGTDAVMLSGESAYGQFPYKAVDVMCTVAKHTEASMLSYAVGGPGPMCLLVLTVCRWVSCTPPEAPPHKPDGGRP
jgi:hypothetical protein